MICERKRRINAETKVASQRMWALELAEVLGNVSEACLRRGMTRGKKFDTDSIYYRVFSGPTGRLRKP